MLLLGNGVAIADEWGDQDSDTGAHPDGATHNYCYFASVNSDLREAIAEAMWSALDPTHATVDFFSSCKLSGSGETDVVWREANLDGAAGQEICEDYDNGDHCDQYYLTLDHTAINAGSNDEIDEAQTACHELGHSVGLTHGGSSSDCMINDGSPPSDVQYRRYGSHHRGHINGWF